MAKLQYKYLIKRKRGKCAETDYYWQCKPEIAEKYCVVKFIALGKDEKQALIKWHELKTKLEQNKRIFKETGILPIDLKPSIEDGSLEHMTELYFKDRRFLRIADITKKKYRYFANRLNNEILFKGQKEPFKAFLVEKMNRSFCKTIYEQLLLTGKKVMAEDFIKVLTNILNTAIDRGYLKGSNPCKNMLIEKNDPRDQVWNKEEFEVFCQVAKDKEYTGLYIAMNLAYYTAQRLTDILNLKWPQIDTDFKYIKIQQSKTGSKVEIPLHLIKPLQEIIQSVEKNSEYVVIDQTDNMPYGHRTRLFSDRFETIRKKCGIREELWFRDLRRTSILALHEARCMPEEIAAISGHSLRTIIRMLDIYSPKTRKKAESAMDKLHTQK